MSGPLDTYPMPRGISGAATPHRCNASASSPLPESVSDDTERLRL